MHKTAHQPSRLLPSGDFGHTYIERPIINKLNGRAVISILITHSTHKPLLIVNSSEKSHTTHNHDFRLYTTSLDPCITFGFLRHINTKELERIPWTQQVAQQAPFLSVITAPFAYKKVFYTLIHTIGVRHTMLSYDKLIASKLLNSWTHPNCQPGFIRSNKN